ncbi:MAG: serine/threonine-protein kinase [Paraglaciecola sp.]|uniref:serine/threonine-protein kinase n=1 Tax=Paraglaciecola sp. TaxID=1920173 RepID=UPI003298EE73
MDQQKWSLIKDLFNHAQTLPKEQQRGYVTEHSNGDSEIIANVLEMLGVDDQKQSPPNLTNIVAATASDLLLDEQVLRVGDLVEHFEVVGPIGEGGMGSVFLAKRKENDFEQFVAIKVIHRKHITSQNVRRFRRERQILASLNHKNIASFIGGGETQQGQPYIILEYVKGLTITQYCQQNNLNIELRIELFKQVLAAVIYAHQNLIVHRDIKPSNVLVNAQGEVKLLDFGIAKLIQDTSENSNTSGDFTQEFARVLTPANASPEQVLGSNITTRSDVYGLGALLMHLLTDEPVFDSTDSSKSSIESMILDSLPVRPSVKCMACDDENIRSRAKALKGDLDTIVMKALQKEPERRYSSTEHLLEDIIRHQQNYPISAKPDSVTYRVSKFIQRNTLSTLFVSLFVVSLLSASIIIMQQSKVIQQERDSAVQQAFVAKETARFMTNIFDAASPNVHAGESISVKSVLDQAATDLANLQNDPFIKAQLSITLAKVYNQLGEYQQSSGLIEQAEGYVSESTRTSVFSGDISLKYLLGNEKGSLLLNTGQYKEALQLFSALSADLARDQFQGLSSDNFDLYYIWIEHGLGSAYSYNGLEEKALVHYQNSLTRSEQVIAMGKVHVDELTKDLASRYFGLGHSLRHTGDFAASSEVLLRGIEIEKSLNRPPSLDLAHGLNQLASTLTKLDEFDKAEVYALEGLQIRRDILEYGHIEIIASTGMLSNIYAKQKQFSKSIEMRKDMLDMVEQALGIEHPFYATVMNALGKLHILVSDYDSAQSYLVSSHQKFIRLFPEGHKHIADVLTTLGDLALHQAQNDEALMTLSKALKMLAEKAPDISHLMAKTNALYGIALYRDNQGEKALEYETKALTILKNLYGEEGNEYQGLYQRIQAAKL